MEKNNPQQGSILQHALSSESQQAGAAEPKHYCMNCDHYDFDHNYCLSWHVRISMWHENTEGQAHCCPRYHDMFDPRTKPADFTDLGAAPDYTQVVPPKGWRKK